MNGEKDVQQLSLVLMYTLDLNIEEGVDWDIDASGFLYISLQLCFVLTLDLYKTVDKIFVVNVVTELFKGIQASNPLVY